mmetsp:Transcript_30760/g.63632  ORF Transcript_30760/g.63632 Transcript_30760/m.63632 type:complete len:227 (+) Transcript_30760:588-1268(+)
MAAAIDSMILPTTLQGTGAKASVHQTVMFEATAIPQARHLLHGSLQPERGEVRCGGHHPGCCQRHSCCQASRHPPNPSFKGLDDVEWPQPIQPNVFPLSAAGRLTSSQKPLKSCLKDASSDLERPCKRASVGWQQRGEDSSRFANASGSIPPRPWSLKSGTGRPVRGAASDPADIQVHVEWNDNLIKAAKRRHDEGKGEKERAEKIALYKRAREEAAVEWDAIKMD